MGLPLVRIRIEDRRVRQGKCWAQSGTERLVRDTGRRHLLWCLESQRVTPFYSSFNYCGQNN